MRPTLVLEPIGELALLPSRFVLHPDQSVIVGRTPPADLVLDHPSISRRHVRLWCEGERWMVEDAGSTSGFFLNDSAPGRAELLSGSVLQIGSFKLRISQGAPGEAANVSPGLTPRIGRDGVFEEPVIFPLSLAERAFGRFDPARLIGRGNQGFVYVAADSEKGVYVALKVFDGVLPPWAEEAFLAGASASAPRYKPNFVRHVAWGVSGGKAYLAMDLAQGERLSDRLAKKPITMAEAVTMVTKLARAVGYLHKEGKRHRSIKPSNVFLWQNEPVHPELSDLWAELSGPAQKVYRPELRGASLGFDAPGENGAEASDDVYSLAAILYRCIAGCMPHPEHDVVRPEAPLVPRGRAQDLADLRPGAPPALCNLLARCLAPERSERPRDANHLFVLLRDMADSLGPTRDNPPFAIARRGHGPRYADIPLRAPADPFTDPAFREELWGFVRPKCQGSDAISYAYDVVHARCAAHPTDAQVCSLCGWLDLPQAVLEIRKEGFHRVPEEATKKATPPFVCERCLRRDYRGSHRAIQETLGALAGRDEQALSDGGPTRKELREGLSRLYAAALPRMDPDMPCGRCGARGETVRGTGTSLCTACIGAAAAVNDAWHEAKKREEDERTREQFAALYVNAEAAIMGRFAPARPTDASEVKLPADVDWTCKTRFYLMVQELGYLERPPQNRIDQVCEELARSLECHILIGLRGSDDSEVEARGGISAATGLPGAVEDFVKKYRPSKVPGNRLALAIVMTKELIRKGHRYFGKNDDNNYQDETERFVFLQRLEGWCQSPAL